jgi:purine-binding chemotaxis protein CheW
MSTTASETQFVTLALGAERFALPVREVREILDYEPLFRLPNGPRYLLGLRHMRGLGVPVIDLRLRLGLPQTEPTANTRVLVVDLKVGDRTLTLGLVVDRVFEVAAFPSEKIEGAPDIGARWDSDYIHGVVRHTDGFVVIIDLGRLLSEAETAVLAAAPGGRQAA